MTHSRAILSMLVTRGNRRALSNPLCTAHLTGTLCWLVRLFKACLIMMIIFASPRGVEGQRAVDTVRIQAILVADNQGRDVAQVTPEQIAQSLAYASSVFAPAGIQFTFDPASDVARLNDDLLYYDCTLSPAADLNAPEEVPPDCDDRRNNDERNRIAQFYPGKLVVYFSAGMKPRYDKNARVWKMEPRYINWSNHFDSFVMMNPWDPGHVLAHEIGHYLHLVHSFGNQPRTPNEASSLIRNYVVNNHLAKGEGVNVFEGDNDICGGHPTILCVRDTPPDPGPDLFTASELDPCNPNDGTLKLEVTYPDVRFMYTFTPARDNVMNYWNKDCLGVQASLTSDQVAGVRAAITTMNRQHLIEKKVLYTAVWEPGDYGTSRAIGWTFADFPTRFNQEIAAGKHLVHMQAYDIGGGQIRYDGVWENGDRDTSRAISWAMQDFAGRFNQEIAAGKHLVHMQAYDIGGGQIRYDGVWENGDRGTSRAISWAMQDFAGRFNQEIAAGKHLVHMQAYDIGGGQIRYDAVWEDGARGTDWVMGWAFNDFVRHLEEETAAGRTLVHLQGYDIGDGQIRYDGVWEVNTSGLPQTRVLAETIYPFAMRFNQETQQGHHLRFMQTVEGR